MEEHVMGEDIMDRFVGRRLGLEEEVTKTGH